MGKVLLDPSIGNIQDDIPPPTFLRKFARRKQGFSYP